MTTRQNKSPPCHTPGPWQYDFESGLIHSLDGKLICDMCTDPKSPDTPEHHANGLLVDCAPDLLEGAESAIAAFDNLKLWLSNKTTKLKPRELHRLAMAIEGLREAVGYARPGELE